MEKELNTRLTILETMFKERWDAHDKRSEEVWGDLNKKIDGIFNRLNSLNCQAQAQRIKNVEANLGRLWVAFSSIVIGGIVLGVWARYVLLR